MYSITYIPISNIIKEKNNEFEPLSSSEISELSNSIKRIGVLQPLIVYRAEDGEQNKFVVYSGYNRLEAAEIAGLHEIPCIIAENKFDAIDIKFDTDLYRRHLSKQQKLEYIKIKETKKGEHLKKVIIDKLLKLYEKGLISDDVLRELSKLPIHIQEQIYEKFKDSNNSEIIEQYKSQIEALQNRINELEENQIPIDKLKKDIEKRLKEKEKEIADKYKGESQEKIKMLIEEARAEIHEEYQADIEELTKNLRDMSRAKAEAQKQIEILKEEIQRIKFKEQEAHAINQKIKAELQVAKNTLNSAVNPDILNKRLELYLEETLRLYQLMVLLGIEAFDEKQKETIKKRIDEFGDLIEEIKQFLNY